MITAAFTVPGVPIGKGRPRASVVAGKPRMRTPQRTRVYEQAIAWHGRAAIKTAVRKAGEAWPMQGTYTVIVDIYQPDRRVTRADGSNVLKAVEDGLEGIAYDNDRRVVRGSYVTAIDKAEPRVEVTIRAFE